MSTETLQLNDTLYQYIYNVGLREHPALKELRELTSHHRYRMMQISAEQGQLMAMLAKLSNARRTIEIGVFTGYSALSVALALPDDGELIACDISSEYTNIAKPFWEKAGVSERIKLHLAPASETLDQLIRKGELDQFDMAFIDADKTGYDVYYEQCLQLVRPGGLILIDNVLWSGRVADAEASDEDTAALKALNRKIHDDDRVDMMILPVSDGLTIAIKR
ncbi:class I SAM-dependent methyltransferase [Endozoicomonas sp. GU-1]|uniref:class I SAM-dependent methyltransferase n=1 Tax=Endozoicomonas sp. GU-1 TaxID=3009078 RepID=UPI0022B33864|nr:class I SAM-dependent methyltransferase [Endozoicomonas sp. GU-1]WBA82215.1 class I SAM-dependent methyltransferase [Endozoicomonas sp. GU-1]WBA85154.1 class I SAM-dependent methyltransferase [Endozoicomonas sp. GU-1]